MWPWSRIRQLEQLVAQLQERNNHLRSMENLWRAEYYKVLVHQRGNNKGIRRLVAKVNRLMGKEQPCRKPSLSGTSQSGG